MTRETKVTDAVKSIFKNSSAIMRMRLFLSFCLFSLYTLPARADLPKAVSGAKSTGDLYGDMTANIKQGVVLAGLVIAFIAFAIVAIHAVKAFHNAASGKGWLDFGVTVVVGILMLVAVIYLLNQAMDIF